MKALILGFGPFKKHKINPAGIIAQELNGEHINNISIIGYELPVSFRKVISNVPLLVRESKADVILGLGLAGGRPNITIERVAINIMDTDKPDIDDYTPTDEKIVESGPAAYFSTLPIKKILAEMRKNGIPAMVSNSAGTYVCNTLMYMILHTITLEKLHAIGGFFHLPFLPEQVLDKPQPSMSKDLIKKAIRIAIKTCLSENQ